MDERYYYQLAYDLWYWLFKNPGKHKCEFPHWERINGMAMGCPLCEMKQEVESCEGCAGNGNKGCFNGAYYLWFTGGRSRVYSAHIAFTIRKALRKLNKAKGLA